MNVYLKNWKWFLLSLITMVGAGFGYLLIATSVYTIQASILIRNDQKNNSEENAVKEFEFFAPKRMIENEIEILQSFILMKRTVEKLNLTTRYFYKTTLKKKELYQDSPIELVLEKPRADLYTTPLQAELINAQTVALNNKPYPANQSITTPYGQLRLVVRDPNSLYKVVDLRVSPLQEAVQDYLKNLRVVPGSKSSSIVHLSIEDPVIAKGEAIINQLVAEYNSVSNEDKNRSIKNSLNFIESRLALVSGQVTAVEKSIENYKSLNGITDISADAKGLLERVQKNDVELNQTAVQLSALADAEKYIQDKNRNHASIAPATLGLSDPTLVTLFSRLIELELQRDNLIQTTSEANPFVRSIDNQIATSRRNINATIASHKKRLTTTHKQLEAINARYENLIRAIPGKERSLMNITRQQVIKNNLYTYLLQKREEISLAYASATSGIRIVDPPYGSINPVKPNRQLILLLFVSIGLLIPALFITVRNLIYERVRGRNDVDELVQIPIMGEIIEAKGKYPKLAKTAERSIVAEQIRALRTKLQLLQKNDDCLVLLTTSGISGEGKSFLCRNLSASLALINQPTVLLEMDFRKPDLHTQLAVSNTVGLSDYLNGDVPLDNILKPVGDNPNHWIITCGKVLPDSVELLTSSKLKQLFTELRQRFAYIVVDAPPIGLVADAEIIAPYSDLTLYVVRYNVTPKLSLKDVDSLYKEQRFPRLNLVLNSAEMSPTYSQEYFKFNRLNLT